MAEGSQRNKQRDPDPVPTCLKDLGTKHPLSLILLHSFSSHENMTPHGRLLNPRPLTAPHEPSLRESEMVNLYLHQSSENSLRKSPWQSGTVEEARAGESGRSGVEFWMSPAGEVTRARNISESQDHLPHKAVGGLNERARATHLAQAGHRVRAQQ